MKSKQASRPLYIERLESRLLLATDFVQPDLVTLSTDHDLEPHLDPFSVFGKYHDTAHEDLRITANGHAYYLDHTVDNSPQAASPEGADSDGPESDKGTASEAEAVFALSEIPLLSSFPGAPNTLYLDFDGQRVVDTDWNFSNNNGKPIHGRAYDTDGDPRTFSQTEIDAIEEIWRRVSEDYRPFNINVSTIDPGASALNTRRGAMRGIITTSIDDPDMGGTGDIWFPGAGGVAFVGSWLTRDDTPVWIFQNKLPETPKGIAEAVSHEFGHAFGLSHHGGADTAYYPGHGNGATSWAPIMGAGYRKNLTQWSDGKYASANNKQNDLDILTNQHNRVFFSRRRPRPGKRRRNETRNRCRRLGSRHRDH